MEIPPVGSSRVALSLRVPNCLHRDGPLQRVLPGKTGKTNSGDIILLFRRPMLSSLNFRLIILHGFSRVEQYRLTWKIPLVHAFWLQGRVASPSETIHPPLLLEGDSNSGTSAESFIMRLAHSNWTATFLATYEQSTHWRKSIGGRCKEYHVNTFFHCCWETDTEDYAVPIIGLHQFTTRQPKL